MKIRASLKPDSRERVRSIGSVKNILNGRAQVMRISLTVSLSLMGVISLGPHRLRPGFALRLFFAILSIMQVVRVSGTQTKCRIWTKPPKISWIQMLQRQSRKASEKPPTTGPRIEPPTEENTTKATAYCWCSASHRSAIMPSVTEPPADERPPRARPTMIEAKLGARATGSCHRLTKPKLSWRTGHRPNSSLQGAHSSQPKA